MCGNADGDGGKLHVGAARHGDGAQTYAICLPKRRDCTVMLANSDNGEWAFRPLLEQVFGNDVAPWVWEGYKEGQLRGRSGQ